jgi:hypothetical protein
MVLSQEDKALEYYSYESMATDWILEHGIWALKESADDPLTYTVVTSPQGWTPPFTAHLPICE